MPKGVYDHYKIRKSRETRVCAAPDCSSTFECMVHSKKRYCCLGHRRLGKKDSKETIEKRNASHKARWQDPKFKKRRVKENREVWKTSEWKKKHKAAVRRLVRTSEYKRKHKAGIERRRSNPNWQQSGFLPREDNVNWNGGTSNEPYPFEFNEEFKERIRKRYNHTCMICKLTQEHVGHTLRVHHVDYDKDNLDPDNFVPLCMSGHSVTTGKKNRSYWTNVLQNVVNVNL